MPDVGWYPDPSDPGRLRWWDGEGWTDERRAVASAGTSGGETRSPGWYEDPERPGVQRFWDGSRWTDRTYGGATASATASTTAFVAPPAPPPAPEPTGRGVSAALVVVLALVAGLVAAGVTFLLVRDGGDGDDVATIDGDETADERAEDDGGRDGDDESSDGATTSTLTPTPRRVEPSDPGADAIAPSPAPGDAQGVGGWIAILASTPVAEGRAAADARLAELRGVAPGAQLVLSDDFASLNPGYWVTYVPGFSSEDAVFGFCGDVGLAVPSQCYGRILSQNQADRAAGGG